MEEPPSGAGPVSPGRPPSPAPSAAGAGGVGALPLRAPWLAAGFACAGRSSRAGHSPARIASGGAPLPERASRRGGVPAPAPPAPRVRARAGPAAAASRAPP